MEWRWLEGSIFALVFREPIKAEAEGGDGDAEVRTSLNLAVGWASLAVGAITGLVLGIWSFGGPIPVPEWIGDYDALPRRLLRLGHIAFFGLGILNIALAHHLRRTRTFGFPSGLSLGAMNLGNIFLPLTLIAAAAYEPAKYLMSLPAIAVTLALVVGAYVAILDTAGAER